LFFLRHSHDLEVVFNREYQRRATRQAMRSRAARELFQRPARISREPFQPSAPIQLNLKFHEDDVGARFASDKDCPLKDVFPEAYE
jgi:hypothetical protein